jgi:hypothetical protein
MFARGFRRAALIGLGMGVVVNLPLVMILAAHEGGVRPFLANMLAGYHAWQRVQDVSPASSNVRVDAASTISRFLGQPLSDSAQIGMTVAILLLAAIVLWRRSSGTGSRPAQVDIAIICLAVLLTGHHVGYDLLLLTCPVVALLWRPEAVVARSGLRRWLLLALFAVPGLNWASTQAVLDAWRPPPPVWLIVTSVNGVCVSLLFLAYLYVGIRDRSGEEEARPVLSPAPTREPLPAR